MVALSQEEAHHALKVVRVREGDRVALFDGQGREGLGVAHCEGRKSVTVEVDELRMVDAWSPKLTLAVAWLHKEKAVEYIIRHGTEVGVSRIVFFRGAHSERAPKESHKWARWAIETCKQCGRLDLPELMVMDDLAAVLDGCEGRVLLADMENAAKPLAEVVDGPLTVFFGPEGDFSAQERETLLGAGGVSVSLGEHTFRSEVAAVLLSGLVRAQQGFLGPV